MRFSRPFAFQAAGLAALGSLVLASTSYAQQRDRPSRSCMSEIRQLCGSDRSQIRSCLQERFSELSESCASEIRERVQQRRGGREGRGNREGQQPDTSASYVPAKVSHTVIYGEHQRQQIDIYAPDDAVEDLPMVLFIHGGGWSFGSHENVQAKPGHFNKTGYYFASAGYRVLPGAPVEDQARDVGAAINALRGQASAFGFDGEQIVLMGHSAGAHLAALVATDPTYAGEAFDAVKGVILLDGAGYDVAANMAEAQPQAFQIYNNAFGTDPARQAALSPVTHVGGEDAPNWLALYVAARDVAQKQAGLLVDALSAQGASAEAVSIAGTDHGRMNRELGTEAGAAQTQAVDAFLARVFS
ncbi:LipQ [Erythrobacter sp. NAP1]|uniref:alpha/beta hydrolase n=1 Tax=Erythrobacter sp. NAP1 TaxID=237727 RepID=UPI0000686CB3|nr:alpha/beta hydrolase [Erythrobacter sp. NAP1]EAQ29353.1 LipQ [Erythrobacter sp. NAP1]